MRTDHAITRTPDITLDLAPEVVLSSNQRLHWAQRSRRTATIRTLAKLRTRSSGMQPMDRAKVVAVIAPPDLRRRDAHNLQPTVKAAIDGIVDAGVLPDDSNKHLISLEIVADQPTRNGKWRIDLHVIEVAT